MKIGDWVIATVIGVPVMFMAYVLFVMCPVMMYAEAECLRAGYPKYSVTVGLERYCMNLDGSVTVKVVPR